MNIGSLEFRVTRVVFALLAVSVCSASLAQDTGGRDAKEVSAYKLTDPALAKYERATSNLASVPAQASECSEDDDSGNGEGLDQLVAKLNANPAVRSAIQSAGMTTREYALFSFAIFQSGMAAWALDQPGGKAPAGVSMDNVAFYRKHAAALKKLGEQSKHGRCDDDRDDEAAGED